MDYTKLSSERLEFLSDANECETWEFSCNEIMSMARELTAARQRIVELEKIEIALPLMRFLAENHSVLATPDAAGEFVCQCCAARAAFASQIQHSAASPCAAIRALADAKEK